MPSQSEEYSEKASKKRNASPRVLARTVANQFTTEIAEVNTPKLWECLLHRWQTRLTAPAELFNGCDLGIKVLPVC